MTITAEEAHTSTASSDEATPLWWVRTIVSWLVLFACALILLALVVIPRVSGAQAYTVLTGSMEPALAPGALVVVKPVPTSELRAGDVITFQPYSGNPSVVTHRIIGIYYDMSGQQRIYTQGDANNVADDWALVPEQVRGKLWYSVPQLGRVNLLLTGDSRVLAITAVAGGLIVYAAWMFGSGLRDRTKKKRATQLKTAGPIDGPTPSGEAAAEGVRDRHEEAGHGDSA